jgi:predicted dehydrogenase
MAAAWRVRPSALAGETTKRYRACVIGDSKQGGYGHGLHKVWSGRENIDVVGLADPDPEGRAKHAQEAGAARSYADYREMLDKERPDLVSIGPRWTVHHQEYLLACADIGAHGYLEKPISTDLVEADAMVAAIESKNLKWAIAHQKRMCPDPQLCKKLIFEKGILGDVLELRGRGKEDRRAGGEDLIVLGTHVFDLMLFFMGRPQWCAANIAVDGRTATKDDIGQPSEPLGPILGNQIQATFGFENAVPGYFSSYSNSEDYPGRWGLDIYGTQGIITIRIGRYPEITWAKTKTWAPRKGGIKWQPLPGAVTLDGDDPSDVMNRYAVDDLLAAIEEDREPGVSLQSGRDSYEMIQAVYAAHTHGGRIDLPLADRRHPLTVWK